MVEQLITAGIGLAILGGSYLLDLLVGAIKVSFSDIKWDWRKLGEDFLKAVALGFSVEAWVALWNAANWFATGVGLDVSVLTDAMSIGGMFGAIGIGSIWYLSNAGKNLLDFVNTKHIDVVIDENKADYGSLVSQAIEIANSITPEWLKTDKQTTSKATPTDEEIGEQVEVGQGGIVNPLSRRLPDGDNDGGKGWQCSKYAYYLATGIRMNYAPHPDYGPCNGNAMVDFLVNRCGFVRCGKENGAIFSYNTGDYGHTGMVVDATKNMVNDANWNPLRVGTHYINLDAVGATYCKPAGLNTTEPEPKKEEKKTEKKAEKKEEKKTTPAKKSNEEIANEVIAGKWGNGEDRVKRLQSAGYAYNDVQTIVNQKLGWKAPQNAPDKVSYTYKSGDTFGQVILNLGLNTGHGLWGDDGDVAYYAKQLGISGNIPVGTTLTFTRRTD